jgi:hypothetical protein
MVFAACRVERRTGTGFFAEREVKILVVSCDTLDVRISAGGVGSSCAGRSEAFSTSVSYVFYIRPRMLDLEALEW